MPGAGKSTVGIVLAKLAGYNFIDTDILIQKKMGRTLQSILDEKGYIYLRKIEEEIISSIKVNSCVISTGGSAIYSSISMQRLADLGQIIYLKVDLETLETRVEAGPKRGIASDPGETFEEIYLSRAPLYEKYAHHIVDTNSFGVDTVAQMILDISQRPAT